ncbi:MAG: M48 family metallopeptidase [Calditrichaeota bacterium]|nr:M48 family metallopeptidase [Calditrichota bacterium]
MSLEKEARNSYIVAVGRKVRRDGEEVAVDSEAARYQRNKLLLGIAETVLSWAVLLGSVLSGLTMHLEGLATAACAHPYLSFLLFACLVGSVQLAAVFPLLLWRDFFLERRYGLCTQDFAKWLLEQAKGITVAAMVAAPALLLFFYLFRTLPTAWWAPYAVATVVVSIGLTAVGPRLILPLFHRFHPIGDQELQERLSRLASPLGVRVSEVLRFDLSRKSRKANAALVGMGRTRRIVVSDTLLDHFTPAEVESVVAHELGHHAHGHLWKMLAATAAQVTLGLWASAWLYDRLLSKGAGSPHGLASLPLLACLFAAYQVFTSPVLRALSRRFEIEADLFALQHGSNEAFRSALERLGAMNMSDPDPHPVVEFLFYSHPSLRRRLKMAMRQVAPESRERLTHLPETEG